MIFLTVSTRCKAKFKISWCDFDFATKLSEIERLESNSLAAYFYNDRQHARKTLQRLSALREEQTTWNGIAGELQSLDELQVLLNEEPDQELSQEIADSLDAISKQLEQLRLRLMLQGEHDERDAIITIHVGNGGVDAQDFVEMLERMYLRWAQRRGFKAELLDSSPGEEAGLKSVTMSFAGHYAYGYLRSEIGVQRLIRLSPFDAAHRRQTSFAKVEVLPDIAQDIEIVIRPEDLQTDTFRATGAGGQHINKTDSAVRITHLPSGLVVTCQDQRSQIQNREVAMRVLKARLYELEERKQAEEHAKLRGEHIEVGFGSQIRTITLHPYTLVKDHRTGAEMGNTQGYLDGDIEIFIEAFLASKVS